VRREHPMTPPAGIACPAQGDRDGEKRAPGPTAAMHCRVFCGPGVLHSGAVVYARAFVDLEAARVAAPTP
jgi:hypothetical protein